MKHTRAISKSPSHAEMDTAQIISLIATILSGVATIVASVGPMLGKD